MTNYLSLGLMSGTSMDGIDAVLLETDGIHHVRPLGSLYLNYDPLFHILLKSLEYAVNQTQGNLDKARNSYEDYLKQYLTHALLLKQEQLKQQLTMLQKYLVKQKLSLRFDDIVEHSTILHTKVSLALLNKLQRKPNDIDVIGYHGQTLYHHPKNNLTIQVGNARTLAQRIQTSVVYDFRTNDIENGGQGAPLVPLFHQTLTTRDNLTPAAIFNCGGISNISIITGNTLDDVIAFDIGPGNGLLDRFVKIKTQGKFQIDENAQFAKQGTVHQTVLQTLYEQSCIVDGDNFFRKQPPKSLDIMSFHLPEAVLALNLSDGCATLAEFSAQLMAESLKVAPIPMKHIILAGGGWQNPAILHAFKRHINNNFHTSHIATANDIGWDTQTLEAQAFAFLAVRHLKQLPLSTPKTTGVKAPLSGGKLIKSNSR